MYPEHFSPTRTPNNRHCILVKVKLTLLLPTHSFRSERYLGKSHNAIRLSRQIFVKPDKCYPQHHTSHDPITDAESTMRRQGPNHHVWPARLLGSGCSLIVLLLTWRLCEESRGG